MMKRFKVVIHLSMGKGKLPIKITDEYTDWATADTAYAQWFALYQLGNNSVIDVALIEEVPAHTVKIASAEQVQG